MKKLIVAILLLAALICLAACDKAPDPTAEPTAEPTTAPTADPALPKVKVTLGECEGISPDTYEYYVNEGGMLSIPLGIERGYKFVSASDPSAVFEGGTLSLSNVYFETELTVNMEKAKLMQLRINYPYDEIGEVTAKNQFGMDAGYEFYDGEELTVCASAKPGYKFIGWSQDKYVVQGGTITNTDEEFTISAADFSEDGTITYFANFEKAEPIVVTYHANGGTYKNGGDTHVVNYTHPVYVFPSTLGTELFELFSYEGYIPVEYNTKPDGTGTAISIGSKATINGKAIDLYIIWAKTSAESLFETKADKNGVAITKYTGNEETVAIPETIGGKPVTKIASGAFSGIDSIKTVITSKNLTSIENGAFKDLKNFSTFYLADSVSSISDRSFSGCGNFANLRMIAVLEPVSANSYLASFTQKYEKVFAYSDKDLIVFLGGSSMDEGVDCQYVYDAFEGKYMPVNLGVNRQITTVLMVDMLGEILDENDIIVMAPELIKKSPDISASLDISRWTWAAIESCYDIFRYVDIRDYSVFSGYTGMLSNTQKIEKNKNGNVQTYDFFTASGTNITGATTIYYGHASCYDKFGNRQDIRMQAPTVTTSSVHYADAASISKASCNKLNQLNELLVDKGIKLYFSFCPISEITAYFWDEESDAFVEYLNNSLDFKVISKPIDYVLNDKYTNDLQVHLTNEGCTERARLLVRDIKAALEE